VTRIACVWIPNLPIAVVQRDGLAPAGARLVLYTVERQRAAVYAASSDTGVTAGVPLRQARLRCPQATYLPAAPERDHQAVAAVTQLLATFSPRLEELEALPDPALALDLGNLRFPQLIALVARVTSQIRTELGLLPALGIASNRLVAQHAARRAGAGVALVVLDGDEAAFLAPQPIDTLPFDAETLLRLDRLGLRSAGAVARLPLDALQAQFGAAGVRMHQLVRGIDARPVARACDAPTISRTQRFDGPLLDRDLLEHALSERMARVAAALAADGWAAGALSLTIALDDHAPVVLERVLAEATSDRALLTQIVLALGRGAALSSGVTTVTVTAADLVPTVAEQLELFAPEGGQARQLRAVLDRLEGRFAGSLLRATLVDPAAPLIERRVRVEPR
jgi:nucleotidyltransferase/DNA polymerase involved in DNA repair